MGRKLKMGCDYFPLDCNVDGKIKLVKYRYGMAGYGTLISIYQWIYSCGYFAKFDEDEKIIFAGENGIEYQFLDDIIGFCSDKNIFNSGIYSEHDVLTSTGIQKRYAEICSKRKSVELVEEYLLIKAKFSKDDCIISIYDGINPEDDVIKKQTETETETESKVEGEGAKPQPQKFVPPTTHEAIQFIKEYAAKKGLSVSGEYCGITADKFICHFENTGWRLSSGRGSKMKNWTLAIRKWIMNDYESGRIAK